MEILKERNNETETPGCRSGRDRCIEWYWAGNCYCILPNTVPPSHWQPDAKASLFKRLTEASVMGDLRKGFTILFALTDRLRRVTEGNNRQYVQLVRDTAERFEIIETHETHTIRANS